VTCHQDESNRGMVNAEFLAHCKQGVRIVNVARGEALRIQRLLGVVHMNCTLTDAKSRCCLGAHRQAGR